MDHENRSSDGERLLIPGPVSPRYSNSEPRLNLVDFRAVGF